MSSFDSLTLASPVSLPTAHYLFGRQRRLGEVLHRGHLGRAQRRVPHPHRSPRLQPLYVIPGPTRSRNRSMASSSIFFLAARLRDASFPSKRRAATPAIGVIYGIFRRSLLPRQQSANHNVPGFPQQRSTRRTPPPRTCSTPATTPVSPTCPISTSTCVPTLSFTPEPYTRLRARFARIAGNSPRVSKTRVFFSLPTVPPSLLFSEGEKERKTFVFSVRGASR